MNDDPLIAFLKARLDEAVQKVQAAGDFRIAWLTFHDDNGQLLYTTVASEAGDVWIADGKELPTPAVVNIVFDPADALAEIEARRQRIETYELAEARQRAEWGDYSAWLDGGHGEPSMALDGPDPKLIPGLELALRQDALTYASHPDYREEWRA